MTIKSAIAEVRDQLCLDFADDDRLDVVTANLGFPRSVNGFSDDVWRAIVRALSIQDKLTINKIEAVLSILLGPRVTVCSALAQNASPGDTEIYILEPERFPQVGTFHLDQYISQSEVVSYSFLDKDTGKATLVTPITMPHAAVNKVWETPIINDVAAMDSTYSVFDSSGFPTVEHTVCIGRGTPQEHVDVYSSALNRHSVTVQFGTANPLTGAQATPNVMNVADTAQENAVEISLSDVESLEAKGGLLSVLLLSEVPAAGGTTTTVVSYTPLTSALGGGDFAGCVLRFRGTATPALQDKLGFVSFVAADTFYLSNVLPAAPVVGDDFDILFPFQYNRVIPENGTILLKEPAPNLTSFVSPNKVTQLKATNTVCVAQVQVKSQGWDIFQSDPRHIEVLIPRELVVNDLRTASYIRDPNVNLAAASTMAVTAGVGDTSIQITDTSTFSDLGMITLNGFAQYNYTVPHTWTNLDAEAGSTLLEVDDTSLFPSTGDVDVTYNGSSLGNTTYLVASSTALVVPATSFYIPKGSKLKESVVLKLGNPLQITALAGSAVSFFSTYLDGNMWSGFNNWPGPYCWDFFENVPLNQTVGNVTATSPTAGPTKIAIDTYAGRNVLEVEDASYFPTTFPFQLRVGENSGNVETVAAQQIALKNRTRTLLSSGVNIGDMELPVSSLSGPVGPLHTFPNGSSYRVVLTGAGGIGPREVVEVIGTATSPNRLLLGSPLTQNHGSAKQIRLLADVIRVSPGLTDDHLGISEGVDLKAFYPKQSQYLSADICRPVYSSLVLTSGTDFEEEGTACFNFGSKTQTVKNITGSSYFAGTTTISLLSTAQFPTVYPYFITISPGAGPLYEQVHTVTNNNVGTNELTLSHALCWDYAEGTTVTFTPGPQENLSYTNKTGATLTVPSSILVNHNHQQIDNVSPMGDTGYPKQFGFEFPVRLPVSFEERLRYVLNLIRAAGVKVSFITQR